VKKSYLADEDSKAASKAAADGAPPGFPNGACTAAIQLLANWHILAAAMVLIGKCLAMILCHHTIVQTMCFVMPGCISSEWMLVQAMH
jgi:hypothetical protein